MAAVNSRRVFLGAVAGWVVWTVWTMLVNIVFVGSHYAAGQEAGELLKEPRYSLFLLYWEIALFIVAYILAWLYAGVRATRGAGPMTALKVGAFVGFAAGFPLSLSISTWIPLARIVPLWWMMDLWVGCILAALVAGWLYKD
jgi:hypothetical protein